MAVTRAVIPPPGPLSMEWGRAEPKRVDKDRNSPVCTRTSIPSNIETPALLCLPHQSEVNCGGKPQNRGLREHPSSHDFAVLALQNANRAPNRSVRESCPSRWLLTVAVICPNPELVMLPFGGAKCGVFVTLKPSSRTCSLYRSRILNSRFNDTFEVFLSGPA
jgi:hypothetical protein